jgi:hypothetical protein
MGGARSTDAYNRQELRHGGNQAPDDTLMKRHDISKVLSTKSNENHRPTCVQSKRPKASVPAPRRRRNRPASMVRNNITSVQSEMVMLYLLLSELSAPQVFVTGFHEERSYDQIRLGRPNPEKN